jgi:hypothetical protein
MRRVLLIFVLACGSKGKDAPAPTPKVQADATVAVAVDAAVPDPSLPEHQSYADLAAAIAATVPADARVVGFGEIHARIDRIQVRSALSYFTAALPAFGEKVSDIIVETWIVDPKCGQKAVESTKKLETEVKRPEATKNEVQLLADAAKAAKIQPHAMTLTCKDYETLSSKGGAPDPIVMLGLTKRELQRIAVSAVTHRDKEPNHRPWIALYGGALHNDRFPKEGTAEWSYADWVDRTAQGKYIEIDLIVPEFAEADKFSKDQPWFPLVAGANTVRVWKRGERSFVVILPRTKT